MKLAIRNKYLSSSRYNRYLVATGNDIERAKKLYHANIRLAQAFHPLLSQFEVVLRNSLNIILSSHFRDPDWIINQKTGFMRHASLNPKLYLKNSTKYRIQTPQKINSDYKWQSNFGPNPGLLGRTFFSTSLYIGKWSTYSHFPKQTFL